MTETKSHPPLRFTKEKRRADRKCGQKEGKVSKAERRTLEKKKRREERKKASVISMHHKSHPPLHPNMHGVVYPPSLQSTESS
mmetsp:Transcript_31710/g.62768  ORF Transcript_31710/g.62768 Transcript_31710/m.62768 type:complete len:83 (+) Transcript_31710:1330-1578(+)